MWVMFSSCLSEFENICRGWTGGQAIRKIDALAAVCMSVHSHLSVCVCVHSCSDITAAVTAATSQ